MSTVSIHIEGHEDGSLDDAWDLAKALRHIADALEADDSPGQHDVPIPADIVMPYGGWSDPEDDEDEELATWSVQYSRY